MTSDRDPCPVPPQHVDVPAPGGISVRSAALVAAGGAIGAVARVALAQAGATADTAYPWATFAENITGAFALGLVLTLLVERFTADRSVRLFVCTGALGAFTTYSTVATEITGRLFAGRMLIAVGYAVATLVCGLLAALLGVRAARAWPRASCSPTDRPRGQEGA